MRLVVVLGVAKRAQAKLFTRAAGGAFGGCILKSIIIFLI